MFYSSQLVLMNLPEYPRSHYTPFTALSFMDLWLIIVCCFSPLFEQFVTPPRNQWHYSCYSGTTITEMSRAVNAIQLQTQRCSQPELFFFLLQTRDLCALHNNDVMCHRWFILPLNLLVIAPCGIAFKRCAQRWNERSVLDRWKTSATAKGF